MRIQLIQHVSYEGPAHIARWAGTRGHALAITKLFEGQPLPSEKDFDWLIIMGGPMGVDDEDRYPHLAEEKRLIESVISSEKSLLGVCLGAQMVAQVLGSRVSKNRYIERGWHIINLLPEAEASISLNGFPHDFDAFLWHGDSFEVPASAKRLAFSEGCSNQAFEYDRRIVGLQFHLEATVESIAELIENSSDIDRSGPYVQTEGQIKERINAVTRINSLMDLLLDKLCKTCLHT